MESWVEVVMVGSVSNKRRRARNLAVGSSSRLSKIGKAEAQRHTARSSLLVVELVAVWTPLKWTVRPLSSESANFSDSRLSKESHPSSLLTMWINSQRPTCKLDGIPQHLSLHYYSTSTSRCYLELVVTSSNTCNPEVRSRSSEILCQKFCRPSTCLPFLLFTLPLWHELPSVRSLGEFTPLSTIDVVVIVFYRTRLT